MDTRTLQETVAQQNRNITSVQQSVDKLSLNLKEHTDAEEIFRDQMKPVLELYNGGKFAKNLLMGTAAFIGSLVALGASVYAIISFFKHF